MTTYYNRTNTCDRCGRDLNNSFGNPCREYDLKKNWTGNWLCGSCYDNDYKKRPNSYSNILKSLSNRRTGNLRPDCNQAKGDLYEEVTIQWRGVENLNIENDNYNSSIDHSRDPELGIIQTKGRIYNIEYGWWPFSGLEREWNKEFNNIIFYCSNNDGTLIERIYIFPKIEIIKRKSITIYKNTTRGRYSTPFIPWYEKYRIKDAKIIKKINEIWIKINNSKMI